MDALPGAIGFHMAVHSLPEERCKVQKNSCSLSAGLRCRQKEAASDSAGPASSGTASAERTESEPTADAQDAAGSSGAVPPDAAPEDQVPGASGAKPAASEQSRPAALQGPAVEPERDKHETSPAAADAAQALVWQPGPAARRKARHSKHPSAAQHVSASKEQPAPPPPTPRPATSQRPSSAAPGLSSPRPARTRLEPAAVPQPSHQSSARQAAARSPADGEAPDAALPPSSQWPALSADGSAARSFRLQSAGSPSRQPEGNSYAGSAQPEAGSSDLSRASSSSLPSSDGAAAQRGLSLDACAFPELLGSSPASHGPSRQEHPQGSARQPLAQQLSTVHRAPIRLPRPTPQGTSHLPKPRPAAFVLPTPAQELLASIFSGPAPVTQLGKPFGMIDIRVSHFRPWT